MLLRSTSTVLLLLLSCPALMGLPVQDSSPGGMTSGSLAEAGGQDEALGYVVDLTLDNARGLALANNLGLERAIVESEAARFDSQSAWGSFDWVFDLRGSYSDAQRESNSTLLGAAVVESQDTRFDLDLTRPLSWGGNFAFHFDTQYNKTNNAFFNAPELVEDSLRLSYTQPLFRGNGVEYNTSTQRETEITERQRQEDRRSTRQALLHDVEVAYWELVAAKLQLEVAESALRLGEEQVDRERKRVRAGDGTEVDVLQARTEVATRTESLLQATNDVAQREDDLKQLIYADQDVARWDTPISPSTDLPEATEAPFLPRWQDAFEMAVAKRSDLRNARLDVDVSRIRLTRAQSERLHGLDLELTASANGVDEEERGALRDATEFRFPTYTVALAYNMPLQNRTASGAERAARERLRGSRIGLEESEIVALADVRRALRDVAFRAQAVVAADQSLELARLQLDAEQRRFDADLSTTFEVLQFQQTLIETLSTRSRAGAEYAKSLVALELAQGIVGEREAKTGDR